MKAQEQLFAYYEQWRLFTEKEGDAIRNSSWGEVTEFQTAKHRLKDHIVIINESLEGEFMADLPGRKELDRQVRSVVEDLIVLETRNGEWLAEKKAENRRQFTDLDRRSRNLRQIQGAYSAPPGAAWNSYS